MFMPMINAFERLVTANWNTGKYDNMRFQLCKKPYHEFVEDEKRLLYHTEKMSRGNVELRAVERNNIEEFFEELFK